MIIQVCVGSSCHLKGSRDIVELLQQQLAQEHLEQDVTLAGSFCTGQCNRIGVTVLVDDEVVTGVTREGYHDFFEQHVRPKLNAERGL